MRASILLSVIWILLSFSPANSHEMWKACEVSYQDPTEAEKDHNPIKKGLRRPGWNEFWAAVDCLHAQGDRAKAAQLFRVVVEKFPASEYAADSKELADQLERMVAEDKKWTEPPDVRKMTVEEKISYNVYHLRNVNCSQWSDPGECQSLHEPFVQRTTNAAIALRDLGKPAIPSLIKLLDDRRPTRSIGWHRSFLPQRTVLRYQDAAIQILNDHLPVQFYRSTGTGKYLSNEDPELRAHVVLSIKAFYAESQGKNDIEVQWVAIKQKPGIFPTLQLLKSLAKDPKEKSRVLNELHRLYETDHWVYQPHYALLLADLGDTSKVNQVLDQHKKGKYSKSCVQLPDDGAASANSLDAAKELLARYGFKESKEENRK